MKKRKQKQRQRMANVEYLKGLLRESDIPKWMKMQELRPDTLARWLKNSPEDKKIYDRVERCLSQMERFGDNCWWSSKDKKVLGYYQLSNTILLVPFDNFHEALEYLLGRPVWTHELGLNYYGLVEEAKRAFNGTQDSEEQRAESIKKSFEQLADLGKPVIGVMVQ